MLGLFGWEELLVTYSMKEQGRVRDVLDAQKIHSRVKTTSRWEASRAMGTSHMDLDKAYEYRIYVRKNDLELARYILQSQK